MCEARTTRAQAARALALCCVLGSIACGRSSQGDARSGQIDLTSPAGPVWTAEEAPEPALTDEHVEQIAVKVAPERVPPVSAQSPSKGPAEALVTLQVFSDFECPFCVRVAPTLARIEADYRGKVRLVWRNYPLPSHPRARPAARAALAAFATGGSAKFWQLHDWLLSAGADLSAAGLRRAAAELSLDPDRIQRAAESRELDPQIDADIAAGDRAGIEGTPAVFVNDYYLMGARYRSEYALVVERALREAAAR